MAMIEAYKIGVDLVMGGDLAEGVQALIPGLVRLDGSVTQANAAAKALAAGLEGIAGTAPGVGRVADAMERLQAAMVALNKASSQTPVSAPPPRGITGKPAAAAPTPNASAPMPVQKHQAAPIVPPMLVGPPTPPAVLEGRGAIMPQAPPPATAPRAAVALAQAVEPVAAPVRSDVPPVAPQPLLQSPRVLPSSAENAISADRHARTRVIEALPGGPVLPVITEQAARNASFGTRSFTPALREGLRESTAIVPDPAAIGSPTPRMRPTPVWGGPLPALVALRGAGRSPDAVPARSTPTVEPKYRALPVILGPSFPTETVLAGVPASPRNDAAPSERRETPASPRRRQAFDMAVLESPRPTSRAVRPPPPHPWITTADTAAPGIVPQAASRSIVTGAAQRREDGVGLRSYHPQGERAGPVIQHVTYVQLDERTIARAVTRQQLRMMGGQVSGTLRPDPSIAPQYGAHLLES